MSEEALNESKNSIYMPVQEYNGPGVNNYGKSGREKEAMAICSNYISVFPQIYVYAISTPHPGIREIYKPIAQSNQIFSYRETKVRMRKNV